ncbi:MAG: hypothetical protein JRE23_18535 [Deltaproteobacteria bacterium]|nr:hypothetical protein [Deltaproteobacteria bacterium]
MSNSSSAGDSLGLSVGRNPAMGSSFSISGWVDLLHTCAETGVVTDHSGPNAILQKGLDAMISNFTSIAVTGALDPTKMGIAFSASNPVLVAGDDFTFGAGNDIIPITTNITADVVGDAFFDTTPGALFEGADVAGSAGNDVFTGEAIAGSAPSRSIVTNNGAALVVKATGAITEIDCIALVNVTSGAAGSAFAARACNASGVALTGDLGMTRITMSTNDTLSVTWTITITAS